MSVEEMKCEKPLALERELSPHLAFQDDFEDMEKGDSNRKRGNEDWKTGFGSADGGIWAPYVAPCGQGSYSQPQMFQTGAQGGSWPGRYPLNPPEVYGYGGLQHLCPPPYARSGSSALSRESSRDDLTSMGEGQTFEYDDRFRVDRRKLELLILGRFEPIKESALDFFNRIGEETNATVIWPSRLKIGAKSKKDPHIRIGGSEECVRKAKARIMEYLDTRSNRVTMKMDVSYTDHSHVIGKGGNTIRRVMAETKCHIHFPDSNRSNPNEKSNQVSIAGEIDGVETARARIRELTPLIFCFDLPIIPTLHNSPDINDPYLKAIQDQYNIQVTFRQKQKNFHTTSVVIKGSENEATRVKEATLLLMEHLCGPMPSPTPTSMPGAPCMVGQIVSMNMEISPQHHQVVLGKSNITLKLIMQRTNTTILFPDASDPNIPSIRRGSVAITGSIHNVYLARQQLIGSLPIVMMFDINDDCEFDEGLVQSLQNDLDIQIAIKPKVRQSNKSVIIKAQERNVGNIYKARCVLLNIDDMPTRATIPESYNIQAVSPTSGLTLPVNHRTFPPGSNAQTPLSQSKPSFQFPTPGSNNNNNIPKYPFPGFLATIPPPPVTKASDTSTGTFAPPPPSHPFAGALSQAASAAAFNWPFPNSIPPNHPFLQDYAMYVLNNITRLQQQQQQSVHGKRDGEKSVSGPMNDLKETDLRRNSNNNLLAADLSSPPIPGTSPRNSSPLKEDGNVTNNFGKLTLSDHSASEFASHSGGSYGKSSPNHEPAHLNNNQPDFSLLGDRRAPGCEKGMILKAQEMSEFDYDHKKLLATKAMQQKPCRDVVRKPNPSWSGLGFSCSMPEATLAKSLDTDEHPTLLEEGCDDSAFLPENGMAGTPKTNPFRGERGASHFLFGNSSAFDNLLQSEKAQFDGIKSDDDLPSVFARHGLAKYTDLFLRQEIDLKTFASLTDEDLKEIGVQTFGARRKLNLLANKTKQSLE